MKRPGQECQRESERRDAGSLTSTNGAAEGNHGHMPLFEGTVDTTLCADYEEEISMGTEIRNVASAPPQLAHSTSW